MSAASRLLVDLADVIEREALVYVRSPGENDQSVLALIVEPGSTRPYAAGTKPEDLASYVRRGATTFAVMPDEVRSLARGDEAVRSR